MRYEISTRASLMGDMGISMHHLTGRVNSSHILVNGYITK